MVQRPLVPLALLVAATLTIAGCGGGGGNDEGEIVEVIERMATTAHPSNCTELETQRFNEQNTQRQGKAATRACEEEVKAGRELATGAQVSHVEVSGEKATAQAGFEGGSLASQTLELALVQEDGAWKLDQVEGFATYDGKALAEAFEKGFDERPEGLSRKQATCIAAKIAGSSKAEAEKLFFGGSSTPIIELAEGCA